MTHDAAHTWQTLSTNLNFDRSSSNEHVEQFSFINLSLGWALTVDNDARALWQTSDGGRTWQQLKALLEDPDAAPALARSPNDYVAPDGLVYKTVYDSAHFQVREAYLGSTKNWDRQTFSMPVERVAGPSLDLGLSPTQSRQKDDLCYAQSVLHENAINGSNKSLCGLPPVDESTAKTAKPSEDG